MNNMENRNLKEIEPDEMALCLQKYIAHTFNDMLGVTVIKYQQGYCMTRTAIRPEFTNPIGSIHGGLLCTIADTTAGISTIRIEEDSTVTTISSDMQFLRPAMNLSHIYCQAEMIKDGKRIAFADVKLMTEDGILLAKGSFTFARIQLPGPKKRDTTDLNQ